jgi:hypothetical protein
MAYGSLSPMSSKSSISVTPYMTLSYVLHVLDFASSLLSIVHITYELNCHVIFYSHYCFFQDLLTGRMIGSGGLRDGFIGLYHLDSQPKTQGWLTRAYHIVRADESVARIWLWHWH